MPTKTSIRRLAEINADVTNCTRCPELRAYCSDVAETKRKSYANDDYWGRPVPAFGDARARFMIIGLAPAAHGANRTGRMFTGDRSGDFLFAALHRAGFASQPDATHREDGLELTNCYITAPCRCAPPANKPTAQQLANCAPYVEEEFRLINPLAVLCLGGIAWTGALRVLAGVGAEVPKPRPKFAHGAECRIGTHTLFGCYHVSQQNTFTGRLTEAMIDDVLARIRIIIGEQRGD
ncbi:MAG: uracil-DNA glycosylase [Planctomycetota bacterium]